ncbi:DUF7504 family protein [Natronolimnohabitans innermongolicus]|uniref:Uncharacterized protein n=1 Tax=Natronolimnohabitans innermongolicus JCM 12255 TaxID=1227499 RepID=L9XHB1_9EURY|nr:hypothetical protein [Natronolimnohabitans innermongolicus]ELY61129.1 hypothetical protein C493_03385 [Natronolimnohabitans innermongolicus JCM 12255]
MTFSVETGDDEPTPGSNTLVLGPRPSARDLVTRVEQARANTRAAAPLVVVTVRHSVESILEAWQAETGSIPPQLHVIDVGETIRSAAAAREPSTHQLCGATVSVVADDDLPGLQTAITTALDRWDDQEPPWLWLDGVTDLVVHHGLQTAFRFLHVITVRVRATGAIGYYTAVEGEHTDVAVTTLAQLCDELLEG